jgi:hypothetical protein
MQCSPLLCMHRAYLLGCLCILSVFIAEEEEEGDKGSVRRIDHHDHTTLALVTISLRRIQPVRICIVECDAENGTL